MQNSTAMSCGLVLSRIRPHVGQENDRCNLRYMPDLVGYVSPQLTLAVYYAIGQFSAFSSQACSVSNNHPLNSTVMMQL